MMMMMLIKADLCLKETEITHKMVDSESTARA